jgi:3-dehydroquinate synthase
MLIDNIETNAGELDPKRRTYIGHGLSPNWEPTLLHGYAVLQDILITAVVGRRRGILRRGDDERIIEVARRLGFSLWHPLLEDTDKMNYAIEDTARHRGGLPHIPVPTAIAGGIEYLNDVTMADVQDAARELQRLA